METAKVIAVILAVFLHHGNGRAITSTNNDNIERMFDLAEEELNTVLNETNENPTEREENPADVPRLSESDSLSHEAAQSQFSDDVSGESANKGSDNVILAIEASHDWSQWPRGDEPECYTKKSKMIILKNTQLTITYPVCRKVAEFTACSSSMANNNNKRKCVSSNFKYYPLDDKYIPTTCSCAARTDES